MSRSRVLLLTLAAVCGPAATAQFFLTNPQEVMVPFDNTDSNNSAVALVNTGQSQTFQAQVQGTLDAIAVSSGAHDPFALNTQIPATTGMLGLADFTSTTSLFSMLALRFNSTGDFTSIPVFSAAQ